MIALLATPAGRWMVMLGLGAALAVSGFFFGMDYEQGNQAEIRMREADAFIKRMVERAALDRAIAGMIENDLEAERVARAHDLQDFQRRLAAVPRGALVEITLPPSEKRNENDTGIGVRERRAPNVAQENAGPGSDKAPGASGGAHAAARLSATACGLWNDALGAGATAAERPGWIAGANPCAGAVEIDEALVNLRENAALLGQCRAREQATHDWMREVGLVASSQ